MVLVQADVYVKKDPGTKTESKGEEVVGSTTMTTDTQNQNSATDNNSGGGGGGGWLGAVPESPHRWAQAKVDSILAREVGRLD